MKKELLFTLKSPCRDTFRIHGFRFGSGKKSVAIVGAMRGDEVQQQYVCARVVNALLTLEDRGAINPEHEILVIPSANHFSMNISKRFWAMDNTDVNRMFPGFSQGETTQRIAAALFKQVQGYSYGIQLASFYMSGDCVPHIRMMRTGYEDEPLGKSFGLPYTMTCQPRPYDTTLLNYNWQIWKTKAYSLYCGQTASLDEQSAQTAISAILRFMDSQGIIKSPQSPAFLSQHVPEEKLVHIKAHKAGILFLMSKPHDHVARGQILGHILDPYDGSIRWEIQSPIDGTIFHAANKPLVLENGLLFRIIPDA
ncbi:MAG: M14 family metallopeptidase [Pseudomonadota bacterium]